MKYILLVLTLLSSAWIPFVSAYAERGAAERVLYYYAYLAEEFTVPEESERKIGVGCAKPGKRCSFNDFVKYIWAPRETKHVKDTTRPAVEVLKTGEKFEDRPIANLYNRVSKWKDPSTEYGVTGNVDRERVYAGSADYYDALSKVASPIGELQQVDTKELTKEQIESIKRIKEQGPIAARLVYDLRLKDLDPHRVTRVAEILKLKPEEIVRNPITRNTAGLLPNLKAMDAAATIEALAAKKVEITPDQFEKAIDEWKTGGQQAKDHWKALQAAESSVKLSSCSKSA